MKNVTLSTTCTYMTCLGTVLVILNAASAAHGSARITSAATQTAMRSGPPASANHYGLTISTGSTYNVSFDNGVFTATGDNAVLNVNDLENALAAGDVEVTTDNGSGGDEKGDLHVDAAFSWTTASGLTLDAYRSIFVAGTVTVSGAGPVALQTNDGGNGGTLTFQSGGSLSFASTANGVSVNGVAFTLENSLPTLASAIASNPGGSFALANSYDASQDGTYYGSPIATAVTGIVEGFGNTISNLSIKGHPKTQQYVGLFSNVGTGGIIENMNVAQLTFNVSSNRANFGAGGLVGLNEGSLSNDYTSGSINVRGNGVGGLVATNSGTISSSRSAVRVQGSTKDSYAKFSHAGGLVALNEGTVALSSATGPVRGHLAAGLVAENDGTISESFATGRVTGGGSAILGGLVGYVDGTCLNCVAEIQNSYATGVVKGGMNSEVGGFEGDKQDGHLATSYSTGAVSNAGGLGSQLGGFMGYDYDGGIYISSCYWDTTTSGTDNGVDGGNESGVTGLTSTELQSGLPDGFDPAIWKEKKGINHGFPYLIHNPPNK